MKSKVAILIAVAALFAAAPARAAENEVVIGVLYPMTGQGAQVGVDARYAMETAVDIINNAHPEFGNFPLAKNAGLAGSTITLKLKTGDFRQRTRSQSIAAPTQLAAKIFAVSRELLAREIDGTAFRLMGTGVSALRPGSQADDSDMLDRRAAHAERAIDDLRRKFGASAVIRGIAYDGPEKAE